MLEHWIVGLLVRSEALATVRWRYLPLEAEQSTRMDGSSKSVGGIKITITIMITSKCRMGRGTPLFIGDTVTNTVLPRFFSRSSVTLSVTRGDILGLSVTFGSVEWAKGTSGGTDAHAAQKSNHERHESHERPRNRIGQEDVQLTTARRGGRKRSCWRDPELIGGDWWQRNR